MNLAEWFGKLLSPRAVAKSAAVARIQNQTRDTLVADRVHVADRGPVRRKGLLGRTGLDAGEVLWIVPCEAVHTFAMKFPIDLIFLDRRHRVKKVRHAVPSGRISGCLSAHSVLELAAGSARKSGTQPGDVLAFSFVTNEAAKTPVRVRD